MDIFLQQILNGLVLGSVYALVALGYTMVYGILGLINFAHGEVVMVGALVSLSVVELLLGTNLGLPAPLARGLFVLSRTIGVLAHAWEESTQGRRNKGPVPPAVLPPAVLPIATPHPVHVVAVRPHQQLILLHRYLIALPL